MYDATTVILIAMIPALVFFYFAVDRWYAKQEATAVTAEAVTEPPPLPLLDVNMDIIVTDAGGRRYKVHFGVMDVQMVEDE